MAEPREAEELLKEGDLDGALKALQQVVRSNPADAGLRVFLFQLLAVAGSWERALNQLNVVGDLDSGTLPMVQTYRELLGCEVLREKVFQGERQPLVFGEPARWIALAFEAVKLVARGDTEQAAAVREEAYADAPATSGRINGQPFEWIADADSRIGPFLEVIVNGGFYWVPFDRVARVDFHPPEDLRDLVWAPVNITWANAGEAVGFMPTRYPGTSEDTEPDYLLGRRTDWEEVAADTFLGRGQRVFTTDSEDYSLLELTTLELDTSEEGDGSSGEPSGE
jgi:type VI secretion system protein ImpE